MWRLTAFVIACGAIAYANVSTPRTGDELVGSVLDNCAEIGCVKQNVLNYLDNVLNIQSDAGRSFQVFT